MTTLLQPRALTTGIEAATAATRAFREPAHLFAGADGLIAVGVGGEVADWDAAGRTLHGTLPPLYPQWLGDAAFGRAHGVQFGYLAGEMAHGISSVSMVVAMAKAHMLSIFGAGGLAPHTVAQAVADLSQQLSGYRNWGVNLLHSPQEPAAEDRTADLLLVQQVPCVSLSAFLEVTPAVVRIAAAGLTRDAAGQVVRPRRVLVKLSRPEVAEYFLSPAPPALVRQLVDRGQLTESEAGLAAEIALADDITVEGDSGGHTDGRPLLVILPVIRAQRDRAQVRHGYRVQVRVGAAGGLGTPDAVAAAFAAGAAFVVTGSINQVSQEAGTSLAVKAALAQVGVADVTMAPAADMFEMGVQVQVVSRGTLFAARAALLYDVYRNHASPDDLPPQLRQRLERDVFGQQLPEVWRQTVAFWASRDPAQIERAEADPRHRLALICRWYLGLSTGWAQSGLPERQLDYQVWAGPALGAFNAWRAGTVLAEPDCSVVQIARNLLEGAAAVTRAGQLRSYGLPVPASAWTFAPRLLS